MELANSIVTLQPGMYILRHPKTGMPAISVSRAAAKPEHSGQVQALYTPGTDGGVLRDGKDCIVMQVLNAPVDLLVTAYLERAGAAVPALKIDKIRLDGDVAPVKPIDVPPKGISLIGHIERTGDVVATSGEILGKPDANLRVEGFQVMWPDKPEGVDIVYSARIEGAGETPPVTTGNFCGTRNAARRIVGVTFELTGGKASEYELRGRASFSGGFEADLESGAALSGPSGMEHLTGLRVDVVKAEAKKQSANPWNASGSTRVFKKAKAKGKKSS